MFHRRPSILADTDPEIASIIERENQRQEEHIELIASENYASTAVMAARAANSPTSTPRATPASATTAAASSSTWRSNWRSTG